ncbi:hypothetical protein K435DRAFT_212064 [Dendrothele bispora CBS 962.96]|uniref:Uncharacterized protein n=1 Tax=Dendrothele bispora (strain CBS 962.96) TaxID=1314807 RepID=A0A4S8MML6_DENBC|nr:hypothetical protein K435DRAFT_212064 [Dendrothele bispora CBS 962.96]
MYQACLSPRIPSPPLFSSLSSLLFAGDGSGLLSVLAGLFGFAMIKGCNTQRFLFRSTFLASTPPSSHPCSCL